MKGKVNSIEFNREWAPENGAFTNYYFDIEIQHQMIRSFELFSVLIKWIKISLLLDKKLYMK